MAIGLLNLPAGIGLCRHFAHNAKEQSVTSKTSQCRWLKDRWGFSWQIVPRRFIELMTSAASSEAKAGVFGAMMQMTKFDIAALERAAQAQGN